MFMDKAAAPKLAARGLVSITGSDALHAVESGVRRRDAVEPVDAPTTCRISYFRLGLQPRVLAHAACRASPPTRRSDQC